MYDVGIRVGRSSPNSFIGRPGCPFCAKTKIDSRAPLNARGSLRRSGSTNHRSDRLRVDFFTPQSPEVGITSHRRTRGSGEEFLPMRSDGLWASSVQWAGPKRTDW